MWPSNGFGVAAVVRADSCNDPENGIVISFGIFETFKDYRGDSIRPTISASVVIKRIAISSC